MTDSTNPTCGTCGKSHPADHSCIASGDARTGTMIGERYRIGGLIGRGGMGSVYEARHATLERRFAIKFLLPEYASNADVLRRFENEAKAAGMLDHMNIAAVTDFGQAPDGSPFLVMEYLVGLDCSALLSKLGALPVPRAANIVFQACLGLSVAHQAGIVHRDIKPENLFILKSAEGDDWVKILDFGIAKLRKLDASAVTATGVTMGTIFYMSPEQIRDSARVDQRSDVWALGVVLYELLTNKRPFGGKDVTEAIYQIVHVAPKRVERVRPDIPKALADAVHRALEKEPSKRFPSAAALGETIRQFTNRPSLPAPRPDVATDSTIASPGGSMRPQASTSQLGATALPPSERPGTWHRGLLIIGLVVAVATAYFARSTIAPTAKPSLNSADSSNDRAAASLPVAGSTPLAVVASTTPTNAPVDAPKRPPPTERLLRTAIEQSSNRSSNVVAAPSVAPQPLAQPPVAPHLSTKVPERPPKGDAVPITIDTRNPF